MKKLYVFLLFIAGSVLFAAPVHTHDESLGAMRVEVLKYVNQYRVSRGLQPLVMNETLNQEALRHSQEMARHQVGFGHDGFSGRMRRISNAIPQTNGGAENVAYNYKTARIVVDGWIHSPGHQQNLVGRYNMTGIGIVRDSAGKLYYTQLFLRTNSNHHTHF